MPTIVTLTPIEGSIGGEPFSWKKGEKVDVSEEFARALADGERAEYANPDEAPAPATVTPVTAPETPGANVEPEHRDGA